MELWSWSMPIKLIQHTVNSTIDLTVKQATSSQLAYMEQTYLADDFLFVIHQERLVGRCGTMATVGQHDWLSEIANRLILVSERRPNPTRAHHCRRPIKEPTIADSLTPPPPSVENC
ncbi:hypothetical protein PIB30_057718 [Stylosanthes scabra]|uniref:Uncharacterized protein n=1 Tax=Stylosanthes scabra TaxID=79078 RepID=A0ABU6ZIG0_9FABA|nr:hypothetical protein [Stylosanthes scabra]